jgi:tRNA A-37 threonylcarbamoyl transferase component Bud32/tetratricopeptide (TPR) repeat protein
VADSAAFDRLKLALADRYQIVREIGSGGMATVYLATDIRHQRRVALKVLRPELSATMGPERFLQEVRVTANLQHPHILPLFDSGEADGFLYFVMPFVEGESLREKLIREGELPVAEAARLLRDVVDALAAAHALGIVHRDIKPENIMLSGRHAMVTDFGVAKAVSEATGRSKLTTAGVALGTPSYMAPEQAAADEHIDHRADIYAVGAVAYELLTGRPPFTGRTAQQILAAQVTIKPSSVTELRATVPTALETLIMRCLEKKPADRWQRAEEMLPHLEAFATPSGGMTPAQMTPAQPAGRSRRWLRAAVPAAVAAVLAIALRAVWPTVADVMGFGRGAAAVDEELFAVFPFRVSSTDPTLAYLREGMVDLLHVKLGTIHRSVEPRTLLDGWRRAGGGEADVPLDEVVQLSGSLSAGRVVLGSIVGSPQQLTLSASLYEAPGGDELATASVSGTIEELPMLIDRLTAEIVSLEAGESADRLDALTTTSVPALLAYLNGMASYRRGLYQAATRSFVSAVEADSTFALAALYLGEANSMVPGGVPGATIRTAIVRAHRDRLGPRDRAYSMFLVPDSGDIRNPIERWEAAVTQLPDRAEAWYYLADQLFHNGAHKGWANFLARSKEAFARAVALDSTYFTPLHHLVWIAQIEGDTAFVRREMTKYLATEQSGPVAEEFRDYLMFLDGDTATARSLSSELESSTNPEGFTYLMPIRDRFVVDIEKSQRAAEVLVGRASTPAARSAALARQFSVAMNAGRPAEGEAILEQRGGTAPAMDVERLYAALFWDGDRTAAERAAQRLSANPSLAPIEAFVLGTWRLAHGETDGVRAAIDRNRGTGSLLADSLRAAALEAQLAQLVGDPRVDSLTAVLDDLFTRATWSSSAAFVLADLYEARGDLPRALATTYRTLWNLGGDRAATTFLREQGRLAAALGRREDAIEAYSLYLEIRSPRHEPSLEPQVDSVRAALAALKAGG